MNPPPVSGLLSGRWLYSDPLIEMFPPILCRTIYKSVVYLNNTLKWMSWIGLPKELNQIFKPHLGAGWFLYSSKWAYEIMKVLAALEELS